MARYGGLRRVDWNRPQLVRAVKPIERSQNPPRPNVGIFFAGDAVLVIHETGLAHLASAGAIHNSMRRPNTRPSPVISAAAPRFHIRIITVASMG